MRELKMKWFTLLALVFLAMVGSVFAAQTKLPTSANEAFTFSTTVIQPNEIIVHWHIAPGTYLYRNHIKISFSPKTKADIAYPAGEFRQQIKDGKEEVYSGQLSIPVKLESNPSAVTMQVKYQGCSEQDVCFPPVQKNVDINFTNGTAELNVQSPELTKLITNQQGVQSLLEAGNLGLTLLVFLGIGLLLAFTPCVLPMVPILTGIIVGQRGVVTTRKAFMLSLVYVLGMAITYAVAGMAAAHFGGSLQVWLQKPFFILFGSLLFVILGVGLLGLYEFRFSHHWQNWVTSWSNRHQSGTFLGVFSMGVLSTLILSPCVTAPLVGVLMYIGQTGDIWLGSAALFVMGIGMGIPLLIVGMSAGNWLPKTGQWMETIKHAFGFMMLAMSIWLLSRMLPSYWTAILIAVWTLYLAYFLMTTFAQMSEFKWVGRIIGIAVGFAGICFAINFTYPATQPEQAFTVVKNISELNIAFEKAKAAHKPVALDFYADWCEACLEMDKNVFAKANIMQQLSSFDLIRIDLSANTLEDEKILKKYNVIAPPTMLFFTIDSQEVDSRRIVGGVDASELSSRISLFLAEGCDQKQYC